MSSLRPRWGAIRSFLALAPVIIVVPWIAMKHQYALPAPNIDQINPVTSLPQISEATILSYAKYLSEDIGYRTPGTYEHALADKWMVDKATELKDECDRIVKEYPERNLECEVWRQQGSGSHRFDMMNKRLYKHYVDLSNIIVRVSDGTLAGKEHAVLVNSHLDSTLPSPGAADDALAVGVMTECLRVLIETPNWSPRHAIIFLFNNAEESLQDGSHLYSTQHPTASTVRAVVNLEAAGTTGRELLFQATSEQMIEAYSHVPRPFGTIFANEIFSSGIILSDTDFRQFEHYLNVTGLDMAVVGNSYLYHMRKDLVENIQPGVAQHMAENTLALLQYLSSTESPLPSLTAGYSRPTTVFFSHMGFFFVYSFQTARLLYSLLFVSSVILVQAISVDHAPALRKGRGVFGEHVRGIFAVGAAVLGAIIASNMLALFMQFVLGKGMSWFTNELAPLVLYGPAAFSGEISSCFLFFGRIHEKTVFTSLLLLQSFLAAVLQLAGVGSSAMFFLSGLSVFSALLVNTVISRGDNISLWTYACGQLIPLLTGTQLTAATLDVFVPLTGRIGREAPAEHIIATIVAAMTCYTLPLSLSFAHRFGQRTLTRILKLLVLATGVSMAIFSMKSPFDSMHQKRLFVLHLENLNTQEQHLHIAAADGAPGFGELVADIALQFGGPGASAAAVIMDDNNSDWDTLYPFSAFLSPHKIGLPLDPSYMTSLPAEDKFTVTAINHSIDETAGTRTLTLAIDHPGIIWTVVAFDAHVLKWTLDDHPPDEFARHHIKEASFYGTDTWTVEMTIKLPDGSSTMDETGLKVNFIGIQEKRMWPAKKAIKAEGGRAMKLFEEFDEWLDSKTGGTVDALLLGCVSGETVV
ncbi:hypothetical protein SERLA73DRAFT_57990 [Serpula lacrymans var. lacrymans S7.3]|uniref:Peptide hydrolase n=1 Tax=Serpula lacrymans var. lacrymans (strain S7.3) TaxID=936435 RepID=F8Q493_SERL3|nr:hypothetical protein SERLA73DRAFT_57990 [Serpula lacrymans var. lacrymans S7.3]